MAKKNTMKLTNSTLSNGTKVKQVDMPTGSFGACASVCAFEFLAAEGADAHDVTIGLVLMSSDSAGTHLSFNTELSASRAEALARDLLAAAAKVRAAITKAGAQ